MRDRDFRNKFGMNVAGIGSKRLRALDKEYGEGNWNLTGGKGYAASGTVKQYGRAYGGYRDATVYHKLPTIKEQPTEQAPTTEPQVHMDPDRRTVFTPEVLATGKPGPDNFINLYGGNKDTMAHSGLAAVKRAEAAGLSLEEIQRMAAAQGISFGQGARDYFAANKAPSAQDMFASQISSMQEMFQASMQQQMMQFQQMQQAQDERMMALQQQMQQAMAAGQQRPEVAGVKMAEGTGGTPMQIARRGVSGAFGRRGMRISSLNV